MKEYEYLAQIIIYGDNCNVPKDIATKYLLYLKTHIELVHEYGEILGVPEEQLLKHDLSKYSKEQFYGYATHFMGGGNPTAFSYAWLNHIHLEKHHWQHWVFPGNFNPKNANVVNSAVEIPYQYVLEMLADWAAVGVYENKTKNCTNWYNKNALILHPNTKILLKETAKQYGILE